MWGAQMSWYCTELIVMVPPPATGPLRNGCVRDVASVALEYRHSSGQAVACGNQLIRSRLREIMRLPLLHPSLVPVTKYQVTPSPYALSIRRIVGSAIGMGDQPPLLSAMLKLYIMPSRLRT